MELNEVGLYLQKRRKQLGLGLKDISTATGIDAGTISKIENGERLISRVALPKLAAAYRIPFFTLLSIIYGDHASSLEKENLVPLIKRVTEAGIEVISFWDLGELLAVEQELGFPFEAEQIKIWFAKRETSKK